MLTFPMNCPGCGRKGYVSHDRLNTRLHCKKCDAVFHMDGSGRIHLGEPRDPNAEATQTAVKARKAKKAKKATDEPSDPLGSLAEGIKGAPMGAKVAAGVVLVGLLGYTLFGSMSSGGSSSKAVLQHDAIQLGIAVTQGDYGSFQRMVAAGTEADAKKWYAKVRGYLEQFKDVEGPKAMLLTAALDEPPAEGRAIIPSTLLPPAGFKPSPGETVMADPIETKLIWVDEGGDWAFDGKASLKELGW